MEAKQKLEKLQEIGLIFGFQEKEGKIIIEGSTYPVVVECEWDGQELKNNTQYRDPEGYSDIENYLLGKIEFEDSEIFKRYSASAEFRKKENEKKVAEEEQEKFVEKIISDGKIISKKDNTVGRKVKMWSETECTQTCIGETLDWENIPRDENGATIICETEVEYEGRRYIVFRKQHGPFNSFFREVFQSGDGERVGVIGAKEK